MAQNFKTEGDLIAEQGHIGQNPGQLHTIPQVASDELTLNAATQTLTNKVIDASANTLNVTVPGLTATELNAALLEVADKKSAQKYDVTQTAHGFSVNDVLYFDGTNYQLARADNTATAEVIGIVNGIIDANNFSITTSGLVTGLNSLTPGLTYFLSASVAGGLTDIDAGLISKPVMIALTPTTGIFINMRGLSTNPAAQDFDVTFSRSGELSVGAGVSRWYSGGTINFTKVDAWVSTPATGADIQVVVRKNGIVEESVVIPAGQNFVTDPSVAFIEPGDYFTVDVDQVGSTVPGSDLFVRLRTL